jgi:hypothetical protein
MLNGIPHPNQNMIHHNNTNNFDMVAIKRLTLKRDKKFKILIRNASYNITILNSIG